MKTRLLIIIGIIAIVFLLVAVVYPTINYKTWGNNELSYWNDGNANGMVCDEKLWQPPSNCRPIDPTLGVIDDFDVTFGGPGNRHPAFLGYEIPRICTEDMIKHIVKHSNMFFADEENFYINYVGLPDSVNLDDYDICLDELLELRNTSQEPEK